MSHIIGLSMILLWAYGLFTPFTFIGFIEIIIITSFLNLLLKMILKMNIFKARQDNSTSIETSNMSNECSLDPFIK